MISRKLLVSVSVAFLVQGIVVLVMLYINGGKTLQGVSDALFVASIFYTLIGLMIILTANSSRKYYAYIKEKANPTAKSEQIEKEYKESLEKRSLYIHWGLTILIPGGIGLTAAAVILYL